MGKTTVGYRIIWFLLLFIFFHRFLIQIGAPSAAKYLLDVLNIALFIVAIVALKKGKKVNRTVCCVLLCSAGMLALGTIMAIVNIGTWKNTFTTYIFDCRQIIRFPIFLFSCVVLLKPNDVGKLFDFFIRFHLVNIAYIIYQFFTLKVDAFWMRGDNLNGFFGTETGGNTFVNIMMVATTVIVINRYSTRVYGKSEAGIFIGLNLLIAVLLEIKIFFVEIAIIAVIYALPQLKHLTRKKLAIMIGVIAVCIPIILVLVQMLYLIYPWMRGTMSLSAMIKVTTSSGGYTGSGDINRLTCINDVIRMIYSGNVVKSLFGVGLGTANISDGIGTFYGRFSWTHYSWITLAYIYVELGILGTILYIISMILPLFSRQRRPGGKFIISVMCTIGLLMMIYNECLRTEAGYLIYFMIAAGIVWLGEVENFGKRKAFKHYYTSI